MDLKQSSGDELTDTQSHDQASTSQICRGAANLMEIKGVLLDLLPLLRSVVREEVEDVIKQLVLPQQAFAFPPSSSENLVECPTSSCLQLHFVGTLPDTLLTWEGIQGVDGSVLMVELRDSLGSRVEVGPESSANIQIIALDGDFKVEDRDHWTVEEFSKNVLSPREGKPSLLVGKCEITLSEGVSVIRDVSFTDNSKWMKSGKFRLGARVVKGVPSEVVVREAVSKAFRVKERRMKSYQKLKIPTLKDEIWRLNNIAKNGPIHQRLVDKSIHTLKDFLRLYHANTKRLQEILNVPEKRWLEILKNAESCSLTNEQYRYYDYASGVELILDCVFNIVSITVMGQNSQSYGSLNDFSKEFVNNLREFAYDNRSELEAYPSTNQALVQAQSLCPSIVSCTDRWYVHPQAIDQGEQAVQADSYLPNLPPYTLRHGEGHQLEEPTSPICDSDFLNQLWNLDPALDNNNVTRKLKAVCCVTKATVMFMISIQHESSGPKKKQKVR